MSIAKNSKNVVNNKQHISYIWNVKRYGKQTLKKIPETNYIFRAILFVLLVKFLTYFFVINCNYSVLRQKSSWNQLSYLLIKIAHHEGHMNIIFMVVSKQKHGGTTFYLFLIWLSSLSVKIGNKKRIKFTFIELLSLCLCV